MNNARNDAQRRLNGLKDKRRSRFKKEFVHNHELIQNEENDAIKDVYIDLQTKLINKSKERKTAPDGRTYHLWDDGSGYSKTDSWDTYLSKSRDSKAVSAVTFYLGFKKVAKKAETKATNNTHTLATLFPAFKTNSIENPNGFLKEHRFEFGKDTTEEDFVRDNASRRLGNHQNTNSPVESKETPRTAHNSVDNVDDSRKVLDSVARKRLCPTQEQGSLPSSTANVNHSTPSTDVAIPATTTVSAAAAAAVSSTATIATTTSPVVPPSTDVASPATTTVSAAAAAASSTATIMKSDSCGIADDDIADDDIADDDDDDDDDDNFFKINMPKFRAFQANKNLPPTTAAPRAPPSPPTDAKIAATATTAAPRAPPPPPSDAKIAATATAATQVGAIAASPATATVSANAASSTSSIIPETTEADRRRMSNDRKNAEFDRWDLILGMDSSKPADLFSTETTPETTNNSNQPWKGFSVVFIGSEWRMKRPELKRIAEQLGAKSFPSHVIKSTDMVVHGRKGGKKLIKAHELLDKDKIQDEIDFFF